MEIIQPAMTSTPSILESPQMPQWDLNYLLHNFELCKQANGQFCHISTPFQPLANPPTCITMLYAKSKANIESKCSLQLHKALTTPLPTQITPDV